MIITLLIIAALTAIITLSLILPTSTLEDRKPKQSKASNKADLVAVAIRRLRF